MKVYNVIFKSIDTDEFDNTVTVTTFLNRDLAERYLQERIDELKKQLDELDKDKYSIDEDKDYFERYLTGREIEDSVSIWLEEDNTYDEMMLKERVNKEEKENEYEM